MRKKWANIERKNMKYGKKNLDPKIWEAFISAVNTLCIDDGNTFRQKNETHWGPLLGIFLSGMEYHKEKNDNGVDSNVTDESANLVCDDCGTTKNVSNTECPFSLEINNEHVKMNLCDNCYHERLMDI